MPYDWSIPYDSPVAYDVGNPQSVSLTGIPSAQSFGVISVSSGSAFVRLTGIPSAQSFGVIQVTAPVPLNLFGIASSESFGQLAVLSPAVVSCSGITSSESFGITTFSEGQATAMPVMVQRTSNFGISGSSAFIQFTTLNVTVGNFIVVAAAIGLPTSILGVTDTPGNVYQKAITNINSGLSSATIWYAPITVGGGTKPTIRINTAGSGLVYAFLYEFSLVNNASPVDAPAVSSGSGSIGVNVSSGTLTTTNPHDVLVGLCVCSSSVTGSEPGWSAVPGASNPRVMAETLVAPSDGTYAATFTQASATNYNAVLASFSPVSFKPVSMPRVL